MCWKCQGIACAQDNNPLVLSASHPKLLPWLRAGKHSLALDNSNPGRVAKAGKLGKHQPTFIPQTPPGLPPSEEHLHTANTAKMQQFEWDIKSWR